VKGEEAVEARERGKRRREPENLGFGVGLQNKAPGRGACVFSFRSFGGGGEAGGEGEMVSRFTHEARGHSEN